MQITIEEQKFIVLFEISFDLKNTWVILNCTDEILCQNLNFQKHSPKYCCIIKSWKESCFSWNYLSFPFFYLNVLQICWYREIMNSFYKFQKRYSINWMVRSQRRSSWPFELISLLKTLIITLQPLAPFYIQF